MSYSHPEVVELIKRKGDEVSLLVLDSAARRHYDERSIIVNGSMPEVRRICTWVENSNPKTNSAGKRIFSKLLILFRRMFAFCELKFTLNVAQISGHILPGLFAVAK